MIKIIADTTCGLPVQQLESLGIPVIPQIIVFGNQSFRDDNEITTEEFLNKLVSSASLPKTAAPPPALYTPIYQKILDAGDTPSVITPSGKVSGTFRSATLAAADFAPGSIHVLDSGTVAGGLGMIILKAHAWAQQGLTVGEIEARVTDMASREHLFFLVDTLEYLHKGGRIGGASKLVGSLLQIKPILSIKDGEIQAFDKVRTFKQALSKIEDWICDFGKDNPEPCVSISHCNNLEEAERLAASLKQRLGVAEIPILIVPPAIVVHAGPGVLEVSIFSKA